MQTGSEDILLSDQSAFIELFTAAYYQSNTRLARTSMSKAIKNNFRKPKKHQTLEESLQEALGEDITGARITQEDIEGAESSNNDYNSE